MVEGGWHGIISKALSPLRASLKSTESSSGVSTFLQSQFPRCNISGRAIDGRHRMAQNLFDIYFRFSDECAGLDVS